MVYGREVRTWAVNKIYIWWVRYHYSRDRVTIPRTVNVHANFVFNIVPADDLA